MKNDRKTQVTTLLGRIREGDSQADDQLFDLVYQELRGLAHALFSSQNPRNTLQPTALVHEAWIKMAGHLDGLESRRHLMAVSARAMRQVLADRAKGAMRQKRGGGAAVVTLQESAVAVGAGGAQADFDLVALDRALAKLSELNARHAQIVVLRLLGSLTVQEIADDLGISKRTVEEDWTFARTWLRRELSGPD